MCIVFPSWEKGEVAIKQVTTEGTETERSVRTESLKRLNNTKGGMCECSNTNRLE